MAEHYSCEQSEEKGNDDRVLEKNKNRDLKENNHYVDNDVMNFNKDKKFDVYCLIKISKEKEYILHIKSDFLNTKSQNVSDLIKNIVKKFNQRKFSIDNYIICLKQNHNDENKEFYIKNYELREAKKKNFKPKFDLPCYFHLAPLKNVSYEKISFVVKDPLNIMMIEKYENTNHLAYNISNEEFSEKYYQKYYQKNQRKKIKYYKNCCKINCTII